MTTEEIRKATVKSIDAMAIRLRTALHDTPDLAARVEAAANGAVLRGDLGNPRGPKGRTMIGTWAEVILLEQLQADGLSDEGCDPIRDAMYDVNGL